MTPIGFDPSSGTIIIQGNGVFPAGSLTATVSDVLPDTIQINDIAGRGEQAIAWRDVTSLDWSFIPSDMGSAFDYLQVEFTKSLPVGETFGVPVVAGADLTQGQPVAVSRASGQLLPARADTYTLSFIAGVASADTPQGFTNQPAHGAVTLSDWTSVTGASVLATGLPYFLAPAGGLTATPSWGAACVVRVGLATSPLTLVVEPSTPILL